MMIIGIRQVEVEEDIDQNSETFEMEMEIENSNQGSYTTFIEMSVYSLSIEKINFIVNFEMIDIFYLDIEELPEAVMQLHAGQYLAHRGKIIYYGIKK